MISSDSFSSEMISRTEYLQCRPKTVRNYIQIIMNQNEDIKRKFAGVATLKAPGQLIGKDRKRADVSRDKEERRGLADDRKYGPDDRRIGVDRPFNKGGPSQDQNLNGTRAVNFRNLKEIVSTGKQYAQNRTQVKVAKPVNDFLLKTNRQPAFVEQHGISINVNIQNMLGKDDSLTQKPDSAFPKPDRMFSKPDLISHKSELMVPRSQISNPNPNPFTKPDPYQDRFQEKKKPKKPLISQTRKIDALQCTEQMPTRRPIEPKLKPMSERGDNMPLISKKAIKPQPTRLKTHADQKPSISQHKQLIRKLETQTDSINAAFQFQALLHLDARQKLYRVMANYIQECQRNFTWMMRVILVEWMMHVSYEFSMKREVLPYLTQTFHIAVKLTDLYMTHEFHLPKSHFQLVGAAAMFIASKLQEFEPKCSEDFACSTMGRYTSAEIRTMELKICKALKFHLNPPTIFMWANRLMLQWDTYSENSPNARHHQLFINTSCPLFKKYTPDSVRLFRSLLQYIDCAVLHIHSVTYSDKLLACAFMYLVLGVEMEVFKKSQIAHEFPSSSNYLMDSDTAFNDYFTVFLEQSFGIAIVDLLPHIQYAASFFLLTLSFEEPIIPEHDPDSGWPGFNLEQYCSYQTHNPNMTAVMKLRDRTLR